MPKKHDIDHLPQYNLWWRMPGLTKTNLILFPESTIHNISGSVTFGYSSTAFPCKNIQRMLFCFSSLFHRRQLSIQLIYSHETTCLKRFRNNFVFLLLISPDISMLDNVFAFVAFAWCTSRPIREFPFCKIVYSWYPYDLKLLCWFSVTQVSSQYDRTVMEFLNISSLFDYFLLCHKISMRASRLKKYLNHC